MKKRQRARKIAVSKKAGEAIPVPSREFTPFRIALATFAVLLFSGIAAAATNNLYHGHVVLNQDRTESAPASQSDLTKKALTSLTPSGSAVAKTPSDLIAKYGVVAKSQLVATAIKNLEQRAGYKVSAKIAADRSEAIQHGYMIPGTNPMEAVMAGYVPPGMPPEQAAMLYRTLPHTPVMPDEMSSERIARMAGEPSDPMESVFQAQGISRHQIEAQNQREFETYSRERFGPIYVPPLHREHNSAAQMTSKMADGPFRVRDNQISLIAPDYALDVNSSQPEYASAAGDRVGSVRDMTDSSGNVVAHYEYGMFGETTQTVGTVASDFQYQSYYFHAPSGLYLTLNRAYNPTLGRWLNRDPIAEKGGVNLYAYVGNNPISRNDPTGLRYHIDERVECPKCNMCPNGPPVPAGPYGCIHRRSWDRDAQTGKYGWFESTFFTTGEGAYTRVWTATPQYGGGCYWNGPQ